MGMMYNLLEVKQRFEEIAISLNDIGERGGERCCNCGYVSLLEWVYDNQCPFCGEEFKIEEEE